jgi:RNA polymerase sigma-70 factor (ECF subfamily)
MNASQRNEAVRRELVEPHRGPGPRVSPAGIEERIATLLARGEYVLAVELAIRDVGPGVRRFLRATLRDEDLAADAYSLFSEKVWRHLGTFRAEAAFRSWAFRVAANAARSVRDDAWHRLARRLEDDPAPAATVEHGVEAPWRVEEQRARALALLRARLRPEEQELVVLRVDRALPWDDAARVLAGRGQRVDVPTLRKRFERVKATLRTLALQDAAS